MKPSRRKLKSNSNKPCIKNLILVIIKFIHSSYLVSLWLCPISITEMNTRTWSINSRLLRSIFTVLPSIYYVYSINQWSSPCLHLSVKFVSQKEERRVKWQGERVVERKRGTLSDSCPTSWFWILKWKKGRGKCYSDSRVCMVGFKWLKHR